ncbi:hypothetical protein NP493_134g04012 [Ridgeia piscesae]|uniref:Uncharacterized protein n=1 Tax=Ridgeia piscesae TaxID=27915 RepID=A0AAD9UGE1_RIDPI|nr:hypothetical protein NP493_134g04012 [Ridgeia piscesae]
MGPQNTKPGSMWKPPELFQEEICSGSFRAQLAEANTLVSYLTAETDHLSHDRKTSYQHDKQLEELRNLQPRSSGEVGNGRHRPPGVSYQNLCWSPDGCVS